MAGIATGSLEQRLLHIESEVAAARAEQAVIVAELDARQVPTTDGCRSMGEWLTGRPTVPPETAHSLARLARSSHERITEAAADGSMSADQAVETVRLADLIGEDRALDAAAILDVAGLRREIARRKRLTPRGEQDVFDGRHLVLQPTLDRSGYRAWGMLPGLDGSVVEKALVERADSFPAPPDGHRGPIGQRLADALVSVCQDSLTGEGNGEATVLTSVVVDATLASSTRGEAGASVAAGPRIGPLTLEQILCEGKVDVTVTESGRPIRSTPATRTIPPAIRRFLLHRDGGACTADGCSSRNRLQPHHIRELSRGGDHEPDNLTTLCWYHHHVVVHRNGYRIDPDSPPLRRRFIPPRRRRGPP